MASPPGPEKRWIAFILIFVAVYFVFYERNLERMKARRAQEAGQTELVQSDTISDSEAAPSGTSADDRVTSGVLAAVPKASAGPRDADTLPPAPSIDVAERTVIETGLQRVTISSLGAVPVSWVILPSKYVAEAHSGSEEPGFGVELVPQVSDFATREHPLQLEGRNLSQFNSLLFVHSATTEKDGTQIVRFESPEVNGLRVVKAFTFEPESYLVKLEVQLVNGDSRTRVGDPETGWGIGWQGGFLQPGKADRLTGQTMAVASVGDAFRVKALKPDAEPIRYSNQVAWAGQERKYFAALLVPDPANPADLAEFAVRKRNLSPEYNQKGFPAPISVYMGHKARELQPGETATLQYGLVIGPKDFGVLNTMAVPAITGGLPISKVTFGQMPLGQDWVRPICLFLLKALKWFQGHLHNWGWAIIVLVLVVKTVLYPLSHWAIKTQARTMAEQQKIKPYMDALNKKYKDDPAKRSQELMKLYREHNINPMGAMRGCIPALLQMPIFFALYILLDQAIELRGQSFLWIKDLSGPDRLIPFGGALPVIGWDALNILPLLMAVTQFFTTKMMSTNISDPMQRQMMVMMPIVFTIFLYNLPSGLMLYWVVQNVWQIGHTVLTKRYVAAHDSDSSGGARAAGAAA
ncbi:membrane protein insertase YidC [Candidatus Poribacteria bacterium]|nr:membrane protein insertase YidC [Candidatus Poribacteria bacterium]